MHPDLEKLIVLQAHDVEAKRLRDEMVALPKQVAALETKANGQFIGRELKVGRFLQRDKILEEPADFRWPVGPVVATGELSAERRAVLEPASAQPVKVRMADLEMMGSIRRVDLPIVELLEDVLENRVGEAFGQLFFYNPRVKPTPGPLVEGFRRPPLRSGLLSPSTKGQFS